jgi:hypothetical protein
MFRRSPAQRLRRAVQAMPYRTREAMLRGISRNRIIAGAYADKSSGGICPMLAAHRNGGRTDFGAFAIAWDAFTGETGARRPRRATRTEVHTLVNFLEQSIAADIPGMPESLREAAAEVRLQRRDAAERAARETVQPDIETLSDAPVPLPTIEIRRTAPKPAGDQAAGRRDLSRYR